MQNSRQIAAATLALILAIGPAQAQNLRDGAQPAEYPPASYTGKQYVDSKGCVFVRAGFDGAVTWVPRVNRKRKVLCGMAPTFAASPAPDAPPRVVAAAPDPAPPPRAAAPAPTRTVAVPPPGTRSVAPPVRTVTAPTRVRPAPTPPVRTVTAPVRAAPPPAAGNCPDKTQLSQRYVQNSRHPVRCGPQAVSPSGIRHDGAAGVPRVRVPPPPKIAPPPGYKAAWEDDRLNPNRGVQTAEGYYQSSLVWTNTVPRRLIDRRTRRDVTDLFPFLKYPQLPTRTMAEQVAYRQNIGANPRGRVVQVTGTPVTPTRVSTKAVPPQQTARVAVTPGHRYVQAGTFGNPANAQNSAARLQRLGLPVRIGSFKKSGKTYRVVLAGPFASPAQLAGGLTAVRRAGFSDAFTRK